MKFTIDEFQRYVNKTYVVYTRAVMPAQQVCLAY